MTGITKILSENKRYIFMLLGIALFLPPLSVIPQAAGEVNMCGTVCPRMFFIFSPKGIASGFIDNIGAAWFGSALVGLILVVTLFFGRLWCSHVCPIGGTSELISRGIHERVKINFSIINAPAFRYGYFIVFIAGAFLGIGSIACKFCNFRVIPFLAGAPFVPAYRTYLTTSMGIAGLATIGVSGFFAKGGRAYCNLLCPIGALDSLSNRLGLTFGKRMKVDKDKCIGCGECKKTCPTWSISVSEKAEIDQLSCMPCRICETKCPEGAISYGKLKA
ncbi:MAG: 4Fe-4S binding protein [Nitrospirae bacterium]|nr:4Fe-4S binding protein [Nitrospirota bacterium]